MIAGSVTVNASTGAVTKSGAAEAVYDALVAESRTQRGGMKFTIAQKEGLACHANAVAAIIPYITANGKARITTSDAGLQRAPDPNDANADTQAPSANVDLALV